MASDQPYGQPPLQQPYGQPSSDRTQAPKAEPYNGMPPTYDQVFKIDRPKWNDLWAGILFLIVCAGYLAVSAICLHGWGSSSDVHPSSIPLMGTDTVCDQR
jgi:hypothetical protein